MCCSLEQDANPFISEHQSRLLQFRYSPLHPASFLSCARADALVCCRGFGTLEDCSNPSRLIQTGRQLADSPVLLLRRGIFWGWWERR